MNRLNHDNAYDFSFLLDKGAEAFTRKMFKHSQSKAQERWSDTAQGRRGKKHFAISAKSRREELT